MNTEWKAQAACVGMDPTLFYPTQIEAVSPKARVACSGCPVLSECREYALRREEHGFWGGMTERDRRHWRRYHRGSWVALASANQW